MESWCAFLSIADRTASRFIPACGRQVTRSLLDEGKYEDAERRKQLIERGFGLLHLPDEEDKFSDRKLRVIEKDSIWVIEDGAAVTFLRPSDY